MIELPQERQSVYLGLGERANVRLPSPAEQTQLGVGASEAIVEVEHVDRDASLFRADEVTIAARPYGVVWA